MGRGTESAPAIGAGKEELARRYLEGSGLRLVERNYRCRLGEIDLIMRDGDCLAFIEVRYRKSAGYGSPAESVTPRKQQRIILAARHYLQRHPTRLDCRFDVLALTGNQRVEWLKNAFSEF